MEIVTIFFVFLPLQIKESKIYRHDREKVR